MYESQDEEPGTKLGRRLQGLAVVVVSFTVFVGIWFAFAYVWGMWEQQARQTVITDYPEDTVDVETMIGSNNILGVRNASDVFAETPKVFPIGHFKIRGEVAEVVGTNAFQMGFPTASGTDQILVIYSENDVIGPPPKEGAIVVVNGVINQLDPKIAQTVTEDHIDENLLESHRGQHAIIVPKMAH